MERPNERVLERLIVLGHDTDLMDWLNASLDAYRDAAVHQLDETGLRITQGKAQVLSEILAQIKLAPETINKTRRA